MVVKRSATVTGQRLILAGLIALIVAPIALSQGASFDDLDQNGNGYISQGEAAFNQRLVKRWVELDENEDGTLSRSEFAAFKIGRSGTSERQKTDDGEREK